MKNRNNFITLASVATVTVILAGSAGWWFPNLLKFLGFINTNSDLIQGVEAFLQILILVGGCLLLLRKLGLNSGYNSDLKITHSPVASKATSNQAGTSNTQTSKYSVHAENIGAVGENNFIRMDINDKLPKDERS